MPQVADFTPLRMPQTALLFMRSSHPIGTYGMQPAQPRGGGTYDTPSDDLIVLSGCDGEQAPGLADSFEVLVAAIVEGDA